MKKGMLKREMEPCKTSRNVIWIVGIELLVLVAISTANYERN